MILLQDPGFAIHTVLYVRSFYFCEMRARDWQPLGDHLATTGYHLATIWQPRQPIWRPLGYHLAVGYHLGTSRTPAHLKLNM